MTKYSRYPSLKYLAHKARSAKRGIEFLLTFDEWMKIWIDSGHWNERGGGRGKYCMGRYGDVGPYAIDNVKIILYEENSREWRRKLGAKRTYEVRAKMSLSARKRKASDETKKKISIGMSRQYHKRFVEFVSAYGF